MLIRRLVHTIKKRFEPKALVLMYHRVAQLESDVWRLAVSPQHFEQHLQVLKKNWRVIPLAELIHDLRSNKLKNNSTAITFDDGYADNFLAAKPLLEAYNLPATFFISSGNIGRQSEFWWDELEQLLLLKEQLPKSLSISIGEGNIDFSLSEEEFLTEERKNLQRSWKVYLQPPPTQRCALFLQVWEAMRLPSYNEQQECLRKLREWAETSFLTRPKYLSMSLQQIKELGRHGMFSIGAHTVTHPYLAKQPMHVQRDEILANISFLEKTTGNKIDLFSYPYGSYNKDTLAIANEANIKAAVTTHHEPVKKSSDTFQLGRFLVDDWNGDRFESNARFWLRR